MIYEAVLEAQRQIFAAMRPGVAWSDLHRLMWRVQLQALIAAGLLLGDLDEMMAAGLGAVFTPCGMGHLIGLDCHDVGGYMPGCPPRSAEAGLAKLRTARILEAGMCLTVRARHLLTLTLTRSLTRSLTLTLTLTLSLAPSLAPSLSPRPSPTPTPTPNPNPNP